MKLGDKGNRDDVSTSLSFSFPLVLSALPSGQKENFVRFSVFDAF